MHILLVDDEEAYAKLLGLMLRKLGHVPTLAFHPEDALERVREEDFDAVITDIDMPVMSGVELARAIRAEREDMPIAFCTGSPSTDSARQSAAQYGKVVSKVSGKEEVKELLRELRLAGKVKA